MPIPRGRKPDYAGRPAVLFTVAPDRWDYEGDGVLLKGDLGPVLAGIRALEQFIAANEENDTPDWRESWGPWAASALRGLERVRILYLRAAANFNFRVLVGIYAKTGSEDATKIETMSLRRRNGRQRLHYVRRKRSTKVR